MTTAGEKCKYNLLTNYRSIERANTFWTAFTSSFAFNMSTGDCYDLSQYKCKISKSFLNT